MHGGEERTYDLEMETQAADLHAMSADALEHEVVSWSGRVAAAMAHWLALVGEYDHRSLFERWECVTMVTWLSWHCGIDEVTAREHVRVARRLRELPLVRAAFASGKLSYSKVRALTRMAMPATEADLVEVAQFLTASQLTRLRRGYELAVRHLDPVDQHERRGFEMARDDDGTWVGRFRLAGDTGAAVKAALDAVAVDHSPEAKADALVALATQQRGDPAEVATLMVHVDVEALAEVSNGYAEDASAEATPLAAEVARRIGCDCRVIASIDDAAGNPLRLGRRRRVVSTRLRRALRRRDRHCRFPGCSHTGWLEAHHLVHWAHGGETSLENCVLLCGLHHRAVHERGWRLVADQTGTGFEAIPPVPNLVRQSSDGDLEPVEALVALAPEPGWYKQPFDLATTVEVLLWKQDQWRTQQARAA